MNNIGPSIDPCGTPDNNVRKPLKTLLTFTFCFLRLRYESNCLYESSCF